MKLITKITADCPNSSDYSLDSKIKDYILACNPNERIFYKGYPRSVHGAKFRDCLASMLNGGDVYDFIPSDSIDREYCFQGLEDITGVDYEFFYLLWLEHSESKFMSAKEFEKNKKKLIEMLGGDK